MLSAGFRTRPGSVLGHWHTEIGELGHVMVLGGFHTAEQLACERQRAAEDGNPFDGKGYVQAITQPSRLPLPAGGRAAGIWRDLRISDLFSQARRPAADPSSGTLPPSWFTDSAQIARPPITSDEPEPSAISARRDRRVTGRGWARSSSCSARPSARASGARRRSRCRWS